MDTHEQNKGFSAACYVANQGSNSVTSINGATNATSTVGVGLSPKAIAVNPVTNLIYVANYNSGTVSVINGATNSVATIAVGTNPAAIAINPSSNQIFVANQASGTVSVINGTTNIATTVSVGANPASIAVNPATNQAWVANSASNTVTVINGATLQTSFIAVGVLPTAIAVNAAANQVYVANYGGNTVSVINGATLTVTTTLAASNAPNSIAINPTTNHVYVGISSGTQGLFDIDGSTGWATYFATPAGPGFPAVNPVTNRVYLANSGAGNVTILTEQSVQSIPLTATVSGLTANQTANPTPTFTFTAQSSFSPAAPLPQGVLYQIDTWQGPWTRASGNGSTFAGTTQSLAPGFHILFAFPDDGQDGTSTQVDAPLVGAVTAYGFLVTNPATQFRVSGPSSATVGSAVSVTVTALDAYNNPVTGYAGSVLLSSSDASAVLPSGTALVNGTATYTLSFGTPGNQTVTVTASGSPSVTGTSGTIAVVSPTVPAPIIGVAPQSQTANAGASAAFWVSAANSSGATYQWNFNGVPIIGATSALLVVSNVQAANAGTYSVTVTNTGGSVTSTTAKLTLNLTSTGAGPTFSAQPSSVTIANNTTVTFGALATGATVQGTNAVTYQWFANGLAVIGATTPTYLIAGATFANAGTYTCLATNVSGSVVSNPATLTVVTTTNPGRLINVSCRGQVGTGANQLITGYVLGGQGTTGTETLLIRASGPALVPFGVTGVLPDPQLQLNNSVGVIASNSGWGGNAQIVATAAAVGAFPWSNPASNDAALLGAFFSGSYTAVISGASGDTGIALAEIYDATPAGTYTLTTPRLINISVRDQVGTGGNVLIAGFVIGGSTAKTVLVRASGPALTPFGVAGVLPDPQLQLATATSTIATNSGWGGNSQIASVAASVGAFGWSNPASLDSAILVTLPPGAYTALVAGASGDTGIALVEIYEVP
jgi:YVTN family beta-propeller protein